jgi:hypothetical protein
VISSWVGWAVLAIIVIVFTTVFIAQRRSKKDQTRSHYVVLVDAFPVTHVPVGAVEDYQAARRVVVRLKEAYRVSWAVMSRIYEELDAREAPIDTIGMSLGPVHNQHPDVVWFAPTSKMRLRFQDSMYYHFAGELHNMFRLNLYGISYMSTAKNPKDAKRMAKVSAWIEEKYRV